jgi:hypothetical protein
MRRIASGLLAFLAWSSSSFASDVWSSPQQELRAGPSEVMQRSYGCAIGGATGAVLSIAGSAGLGFVPATGIGCGVGALAAPAVSDMYDRWHLQAALVINSQVRPAVNRAFDYFEYWLGDGAEAADIDTAQSP